MSHTRTVRGPSRRPRPSSIFSTAIGAPPIICRSDRSICSTIRLLREPLKPEHIKPRLLGHWGTTPGLNFIYAHLNRVIRARDLNMIYICGPGHGGPGMVANTYLEGTYTEIYPDITQDAEGMSKLFRQFSFPGGIPSHAAPETPGSIHEGGELGYALRSCLWRRLRQSGSDRCLRRRRRRGGNRAAVRILAFQQISEPSDGRRGAADPASQWLQDRQSDRARPDERRRADVASSPATATNRCLWSVRSPPLCTSRWRGRSTTRSIGSETIQAAARGAAIFKRPRWPMIVLRSPKGWTGPKEVDGKKVEGFWRAHQVPVDNARGNAGHLRDPRGLDARLRAGDAVRRHWPTAS